MSERNRRRILNKIAAANIVGVREALDALNALNWARENGVRDEKVDKAFDLLQNAAEQWRDEAAGMLAEATKIYEIQHPRRNEDKR